MQANLLPRGISWSDSGPPNGREFFYRNGHKMMVIFRPDETSIQGGNVVAFIRGNLCLLPIVDRLRHR